MFLRPSGAEGSAGRTVDPRGMTPADHFAPLGRGVWERRYYRHGVPSGRGGNHPKIIQNLICAPAHRRIWNSLPELAIRVIKPA